jgi:hypothetical protein
VKCLSSKRKFGAAFWNDKVPGQEDSVELLSLFLFCCRPTAEKKDLRLSTSQQLLYGGMAAREEYFPQLLDLSSLSELA